MFAKKFKPPMGPRAISLALLFLILPASSFGQKARPSPLDFQFGAGLSTALVKSAPAEIQGISKRSFGFVLSGGAWWHRILALRLDGGVELFDDKRKFRQMTTGGEKSSSVTFFYGSFAAGIFTPPLRLDQKPHGARLALGLNLGTDWTGGERSIEDCVDCHEEDLDLKGGVYFEPALQLRVSRVSGFDLAYRFYQSHSDLQNRIIVKYVRLL